MRHHFHRCPNLQVVTADASDLHGARRHGAVALDELCTAKGLASCLGLVECDILSDAQKRTLMVARATRLREEDGAPSPLSGVAHARSAAYAELRRELVAERERLVSENLRLEAEMAHLDAFKREEVGDEVERADADSGLRLDAAMERLSVRRLDAIDRALDAIARGSYGSCRDCGGSIELGRLRVLPDTPLCVECAHHSPQH